MRRSRGQQGFVLVIVMGVLALLTVLTLGFARRALLERRTAALSVDRSIALNMSRGAVQRGVADLRNRIVLEELGQDASGGKGPTWRKHDSLNDEKLYEQLDMHEDDVCDYVIESLDGRISLNAAPKELLDEIDGLSFMAVSDIVERRDTQPDGSPGSPFLLAEEVLALDGVDEKDWFGKDDDPGLRDVLTAWSSGRIDVNTAPEAVLDCIPDIDASTVAAIVLYRQGYDGILNNTDDSYFRSFEDLQALTGIPAAQTTVLQEHCKLNSHFFTITGFATRRQGKVRASCTAVVEIRKEDVVMLQWREGPLGS